MEWRCFGVKNLKASRGGERKARLVSGLFEQPYASHNKPYATHVGFFLYKTLLGLSPSRVKEKTPHVEYFNCSLFIRSLVPAIRSRCIATLFAHFLCVALYFEFEFRLTTYAL